MDTLARTKRLEALGFDRPKAEGLVQMVKQSIDEEVAKKSDLVELRSELKVEMSQLRAELKLDIADMKVDIADMKAEIGEMKGQIKALDIKIDSKVKDVKLWLGGLMITLFGLGVDFKQGTNLLQVIITQFTK